MIFLKKKTVILAGTLLALLLFVGAGWVYAREFVADEYYVTEETSFELNNSLVKVGIGERTTTASVGKTVFNGKAKLFGIIPVKSVKLNLVRGKSVIVGGESFGLKMYTNGLIVVGFTDISTDGGDKNPAKDAGIEKGDLLKSINGEVLEENGDVSRLINTIGGKKVTVTLERNGELKTVELYPVKSAEDGKYKAGMWVRDSAAGIGTMSFYDPDTGMFVGLGHGIYDVDTDKLLPAAKGEIVSTVITSVKKGVKGSPGELQGVFDQEKVIGELHGNSALGVYGKVSASVSGRELEIAMKQEIELGEAKIMTPKVGGGKEEYKIEIVSVTNDDKGKGKNMVIRITDERLIEERGGIVQGMSGSPIIQNGKLIGSVTHVLINDPTMGYAVFAERMYELIG